MNEAVSMERLDRWLPDLVITALTLLMLAQLWRWIRQSAALRLRVRRRRIAGVAAILLAVLILTGPVLRSSRIGNRVDTWWRSWIRAGSLTAAALLGGAFACTALWRRVPQFQPQRRRLLLTARAAVFATPAAVCGFGVFVQRREFRVVEVDLPLSGLPADLRGLRLVQLSDIHLSPFLSESELQHVIDMANETKAHIALVTGDLISHRGDPIDACLHRLAGLKSDAGTWGCLGNHETYTGLEDYVAREGTRKGIRFLRSRNEVFRFGNAGLNLAGVDYQRQSAGYLQDAETLLRPGTTNLLLSHNPDVFDAAAAQGWQGVLSGHTHGGQVNIEILSQQINVARFYTPYVYGLYRQPGTSIYVTRGIGTIGVPMRLGAPPEIALIRLCAS